MKRILFLSTGGTIASMEGEHGLAPQMNGEELLNIVPEISGLCQIDIRTILNLDSTNIQQKDWIHIANKVYEGLKDYDGIVISHGTDTMAYTSSILSYMLQNLDKPVILTGSQLPISHPETDAKQNLLNAFRVAMHGNPGVFIVFGGKIINGTRAVKIRTKSFEAFESVNYPCEGHIDDSGIYFRHRSLTNKGGCSLEDSIDEKVFLLKLVPGMEPNLVESLIKEQYRGLVIEGFGAGGIPNIGRSFLNVIEDAIKNGMVVVATTQCMHEGCDLSVYDVGIKGLEAGIISAHDMTTEAAVTKLMWILGRESNPNEIEKLMHWNFCGEIAEFD